MAYFQVRTVNFSECKCAPSWNQCYEFRFLVGPRGGFYASKKQHKNVWKGNPICHSLKVCRTYVHLYIFEIIQFDYYLSIWLTPSPTVRRYLEELGMSGLCLANRFFSGNFCQRCHDVIPNWTNCVFFPFVVCILFMIMFFASCQFLFFAFFPGVL